jgi:hypothetical protein
MLASVASFPHIPLAPGAIAKDVVPAMGDLLR